MANTTIKALTSFSDGVISLGVGDIAIVEATKASAFISGGLAVEYTEPINPSGSESINANGTYDVTAKASAVVNVPVVTLTYNVGSGSGSIDAVVTAAGNEVALNDGTGITPPTNYEFAGWATENGAATPNVTSPYKVNANATIYAVYNRVSYTVAYDVNGGTGSVTSATVTIGESVALNDGAGITPPDTKTFKGWGLSGDATEVLESPYTPEGDVTLYAIYE